MTIEDRHWLPNRGATLVGYVERGTAQVGDLVQVLAGPEPLTLPVTDIERPDAARVIAQPGDLVAMLLDGLTREQFDDLLVGGIIAQANSIDLHTRFQADVTVLPASEGGRTGGLAVNMESLSVHVYGLRRMCQQITFASDSGVISPGEQTRIMFIIEPAPLEVGTAFMLREGARWIARGIVTAL
ncbi:MAG: hypothetical protein GYB64_08765 [Chloroflexi bacterium]|nr:hypothetical protein [Chloroflexota bacterium]